MDNIKQEKPNDVTILNVSKKTLNKKFRIRVEKSIVFKTFRNKYFIIPTNKVNIAKTPWRF